MINLQAIEHHCVWKTSKHSAFTDLFFFKGKMLCVFREATDHISTDGQLRVIDASNPLRPTTVNLIELPNWDLRDPKLSVMPNGNLCLLAYARKVDSKGNFAARDALFWQSKDGIHWTSHKSLHIKNSWLWRLSWHRDTAYGFAYNRGKETLDFYSGQPGKHFDMHMANALCKHKHGLGYPNESDTVFSADRAFALVRRDADSCTAQLGTSKLPFYQWHWHDLGEYVGGPAMVLLNETRAVVAGRRWTETGPEMALWQLDLCAAKLHHLATLPSAGDCSYPGLVLQQDKLWVSYYSSHEPPYCAIYLTKLAIN